MARTTMPGADLTYAQFAPFPNGLGGGGPAVPFRLFYGQGAKKWEKKLKFCRFVPIE